MLDTEQILGFLNSTIADLNSEKVSNTRVVQRLKRVSALFAMVADIRREMSYHAISNGLGFLARTFENLPPIQVSDIDMKKAIIDARSKIANVLADIVSNIGNISPQNPSEYCRVISVIYETLEEVDNLGLEFAALMPPTKQ